jgi:hypothetical protein
MKLSILNSSITASYISLCLLQNMASYLKSVISCLLTKPWTKEESLQLLFAYHLDYCFTPASIGWTCDDCERHYTDLYMSALRYLGSDCGKQPDLIRIYYEEIRNLAKGESASERAWCEEETRELFRLRNSKSPGLYLRTDEECFHHYYEVVGIVFKKIRFVFGGRYLYNG